MLVLAGRIVVPVKVAVSFGARRSKSPRRSTTADCGIFVNVFNTPSIDLFSRV